MLDLPLHMFDLVCGLDLELKSPAVQTLQEDAESGLLKRVLKTERIKTIVNMSKKSILKSRVKYRLLRNRLGLGIVIPLLHDLTRF